MAEFLPPSPPLSPPVLADTHLPRVLTTLQSDTGAGAGELRDLKEILAIVRRRRTLVLFIAACCAAIAGYFAYVAKPVYLAAGSVRIADDRQATRGGLAVAPRGNSGGSTRDPRPPGGRDLHRRTTRTRRRFSRSLEAGVVIVDLLARCPLRMRVSKSPSGSVIAT